MTAADGDRRNATAESGAEPAATRRPSVLDVVRWLFLVLAVGFGWWGLREYHSEIGVALGRTSPGRVLLSLAIVLGGLVITGTVWRAILSAWGHAVPPRPAAAIFFVGQLGKYIPGSVWSLGAQADMARRYAVPVRTTVAVGLVFLYVHLVTALLPASLLGVLEVPQTADVTAPGPLADWVARMPAWVVPLALAAVLLAMSPLVLRWVGRVLAGPRQRMRLTWVQTLTLLARMAVVWLAYGVGLVVVLPPAAVSRGGGAHLLGICVAAFAVGYVVGVAVVLAPAGAAVRELTLVWLLAPVVGVPAAAAAAIMVRVVHTVADFMVAGIAWWVARASRRDADVPPSQRARAESSGRGDSGES